MSFPPDLASNEYSKTRAAALGAISSGDVLQALDRRLRSRLWWALLLSLLANLVLWRVISAIAQSRAVLPPQRIEITRIITAPISRKAAKKPVATPPKIATPAAPKPTPIEPKTVPPKVVKTKVPKAKIVAPKVVKRAVAKPRLAKVRTTKPSGAKPRSAPKIAKPTTKPGAPKLTFAPKVVPLAAPQKFAKLPPIAPLPKQPDVVKSVPVKPVPQKIIPKKPVPAQPLPTSKPAVTAATPLARPVASPKIFPKPAPTAKPILSPKPKPAAPSKPIPLPRKSAAPRPKAAIAKPRREAAKNLRKTQIAPKAKPKAARAPNAPKNAPLDYRRMAKSPVRRPMGQNVLVAPAKSTAHHSVTQNPKRKGVVPTNGQNPAPEPTAQPSQGALATPNPPRGNGAPASGTSSTRNDGDGSPDGQENGSKNGAKNGGSQPDGGASGDGASGNFANGGGKNTGNSGGIDGNGGGTGGNGQQNTGNGPGGNGKGSDGNGNGAATPTPEPTPRPTPEPTPRPTPAPTPRATPFGLTRDAIATRQVEPQIPYNLRDQQFKSYVRARVVIHSDGSFDASLRSSSGSHEVDELALSALRRWRWKPALKNGEPVESVRLFRIEFEVS